MQIIRTIEELRQIFDTCKAGWKTHRFCADHGLSP